MSHLVFNALASPIGTGSPSPMVFAEPWHFLGRGGGRIARAVQKDGTGETEQVRHFGHFPVASCRSWDGS
jgi:hypothetical protein